MSRPSPNCGVRLVGTRLYCEGGHTIRVSSGVTPPKPVRSDLAALAFEAPESVPDTVSPLTCTTEGSPASGVGGAFRRVGRVLNRASASIVNETKIVWRYQIGSWAIETVNLASFVKGAVGFAVVTNENTGEHGSSVKLTTSRSSRVVLESAATRKVFLCPEEEGTVRGAPDTRPFLVTSPISPLCHIARFRKASGRVSSVLVRIR